MTFILYFLNIGTGELFVILLFIIIFFGSKSIPELARGLGKGIREFKNASDSVKREISDSVSQVNREIENRRFEINRESEEIKKEIDPKLDQNSEV